MLKSYLPKSNNWSNKMCQRIDQDNIEIIGSPFFARKISQLPDLPEIDLNTLLPAVMICYSTFSDQQLHQHLKFRELTIKQFIKCGYCIDYIDQDEHVNFSRWIDKDRLQICRIEFL